MQSQCLMAPRVAWRRNHLCKLTGLHTLCRIALAITHEYSSTAGGTTTTGRRSLLLIVMHLGMNHCGHATFVTTNFPSSHMHDTAPSPLSTQLRHIGCVKAPICIVSTWSILRHLTDLPNNRLVEIYIEINCSSHHCKVRGHTVNQHSGIR